VAARHARAAGERESLAGQHDLSGLVVIRSLTKTWGLAGLRVGYLLAVPDTVRLLAAAQPLWAVSTPALAACVATASPAALREAAERATGLAPVCRGAGGRARPAVQYLIIC
jgi:histidinol-phosphate aminotransferase